MTVDELLYDRVKQLKEIDDRLERIELRHGLSENTPIGADDLHNLRLDIALMIQKAEQDHTDFLAHSPPIRRDETMSCPTCGHTMHGIGEVPAVGGQPAFWCPRCGTLIDHSHDSIGDAPKLVQRCRTFEATLAGVCAEHLYQWKASGVAESINTPQNRPT